MSGIRKVVPLLVIITLLSKIFGAGRDLALSYYYGSSSISDAYLLATTIPVTVFSFVYEGIGASFIPACTRLNTKKKQNQFTSNLINILLLISLAVIVLIEIFPKYAILIFAAGFDENTLNLSVEILQISVTGVLFSAVTYVFVSYLNFNNQFISAAARAIPMDIVVIASIAISAKSESLIVLSLGIVLSLFVSLLFLFPDLKRIEWHYYKILDYKDPNIKSIFTWSLPVVLSMALADINSIVDRQFASHLAVGGISSITYSNRLVSIVSALFFAPLLTFLFPNFSKNIQEGKIVETRVMVEKVLRHLIVISLPILMFMFVSSANIIHIVFERGAFNAEASLLTSECLRYYSLSIFAVAIITVTTKVFYSFADMWTPMKISSIGVFINITGNFIITRFWGLSGLALTSSISLTIVAVLQLYFISKKLGLSMRDLFVLFSKVCGVVILFSAIVTIFRQHFLSSGVVLDLIVSVLFIIIAYPLLLHVIKVGEIKEYIDIFHKHVSKILIKTKKDNNEKC